MKKFRFMPTEENFFELFDDISQVLVDAAACLRELIANYNEVDEKCRILRDMEKRVDGATDGIVRRLNISFVTPIDREDICTLATSLDDVLDYMEASADRMKLYGVEQPREEALALADLIIEAVRQVREGVSALNNFRDIDHVLAPCKAIKDIEHRADLVQREALGRLFKEETNPLEIAKWQEIFDRLETVTDRCDDVGDVLQSIVVKNA